LNYVNQQMRLKS